VFDGVGNLYVANRNNGTVSVFAPGATTPSAILTGLAGPGILAFDASGNLYVLNNDIGNGSRPELDTENFLLKAQAVELFQHFDRLGDGTIQVVEIKHGLPFRMLIAEAAA
jgi:DNA-binding beta-propeller fold protein YncE